MFPWIGDKATDSIKPTEVVRCLHRIKDRGNLETAQRVREAAMHIYQYAADTGPSGPVFPNMARRSDKSRYISANTINSGLRTLGYDTQEQVTGHGFRATARTMIRECLG